MNASPEVPAAADREPETVETEVAPTPRWRQLLGSQRLQRALMIALVAPPLLVAIVLAFLVSSHARTVAALATRQPTQPSRLYSQPLDIRTGDPIDIDAFEAELQALDYQPEPGDAVALSPGRYRRAETGIDVRLRRFDLGPERVSPVRRVGFHFDGGKVRKIESGGQVLEHVLLEPKLLAAYYDDQLIERRPIDIEELPEHVTRSFLAAEDSGFFDHTGISVAGIFRAALSNLRAGRVCQGGSTITQQLVKNVFLTSERTFSRKAREAMLALAVERRFDKATILQAYLDEVYFGVDGPVNLVGLGAAAYAYFGKEARDLTLDEAATLAAMVSAPARFHPERQPQRARERRNLILARMADLGWVSAEQADAAQQRPVAVARVSISGKNAPHFADAMAREAAERFGVEDLAGRGYRLYSTLGWRDQRQAEQAAKVGLEDLEAKGREGVLEVALVSLDPTSGAIRAYVGGRDYDASRFDRASMARRQAGSAFKPIVYATALAYNVAEPYDTIADVPTEVRYANGLEWRPRNDDRAFRGEVTMRQALARSLNVPTVRLALASGLDSVRDMARAVGIRSHLAAQPSLALGAFEVTPIELASVYTTFAAGGTRQLVHGLAAVEDADGGRLTAHDEAQPEPVLTDAVAYQMTRLLRGVVDSGTGYGVRRRGLTDPIAGKTGTSNDARDNWFAGYSADRVAVVWVGRDDNAPTHLSGSRAALPIWTRFMKAMRPAGGYPEFPRPAALIDVSIDPESGALATPRCPHSVIKLVSAADAPQTECPLSHEPEPLPIHDQGYQLAASGDAAAATTAYGSAAAAGPAAIVVTNPDGRIEVETMSADLGDVSETEVRYDVVEVASARHQLRFARAASARGDKGSRPQTASDRRRD